MNAKGIRIKLKAKIYELVEAKDNEMTDNEMINS